MEALIPIVTGPSLPFLVSLRLRESPARYARSQRGWEHSLRGSGSVCIDNLSAFLYSLNDPCFIVARWKTMRAQPSQVRIVLSNPSYVLSLTDTVPYYITVLVFYDYFLTLDLEVQNIWTKKFRGPTLIFFLNRYLCIGLALALLLPTETQLVRVPRQM